MERLTLSFSTVECSRCGARRQTRFRCPDCGNAASPAEIDINVQSRQRAVQDAASARSGAANRLEASAAELLKSGELAELPRRVFGAADRLARAEPDAPREFAGIAAEIASLERWADEVNPLRPMITLTRCTQSVVASLVQMYDVVAAALVEERLARAQQAADTVQSALDAASAGQLPSTLKRGRWIQAGHEYDLDEGLAFGFLEQVVAGVLLAHSALDNFSIELLPEGSTYTDPETGEVHDRRWIESLGVEYRLSPIAAAVTGKPNIRTYDTALWDGVTTLKGLRDDVVHARWETGYSRRSADDTIYGRLLRDADVQRHGETAAAVIDHYRAA